MRRELIIIVLVGLSLAFLGCLQHLSPEEKIGNDPVQKCVLLCEEAKEKGLNLSSGPCLSNNLAPGWVCDVAHWPREAVDNDPKNQCSEYGKSAWAFVEVNPDCEPIRVWDGTNMQILGTS